MAQGRCSGCGKTGSERKINDHAMECDSWQLLYREHPEQALDAAAEYARWKAEDAGRERDERRDRVTTVGEAARAASLDRFAYVDPLGD